MLGAENRAAERYVDEIGKATNVSVEVREAVRAYWDTAETEVQRATVIPFGLVRRYSAYREVLALHGNGDSEGARARLTDMMKTPEVAADPYLAAYVHLDAARVAMALGDSIDALAHANAIRETLWSRMAHRADVSYIQIMCEYRLLRRESAFGLALQFLKTYPAAPHAMRRKVATLVLSNEDVESGSIEDVRDHMAAAGAHLSGRDGSEQAALTLQEQVESMLTALIGDGEKETKEDDPESRSAKPRPKTEDPQQQVSIPSGNREPEDGLEVEDSQKQSQRLTRKAESDSPPRPPPPSAGPPKPSPQQMKMQSQSEERSSSSKSLAGSSSGGGETPKPGPRGIASGTGKALVGATASQLASGSAGGPDGSGQDATRAAGEQWGAMPPREREKVLNVVGSSFPETYRDVVEQYYRGLTEGRMPRAGDSDK